LIQPDRISQIISILEAVIYSCVRQRCIRVEAPVTLRSPCGFGAPLPDFRTDFSIDLPACLVGKFLIKIPHMAAGDFSKPLQHLGNIRVFIGFGKFYIDRQVRAELIARRSLAIKTDI
jgi:hypothetical protein